MSFNTDSLALFLPLPEPSSLLQRSLSSSSTRPQSYHPPPLSRNTSVISRRGSLPNNNHPHPRDQAHLQPYGGQATPGVEITITGTDDDDNLPTQTSPYPPPAYGSGAHHGGGHHGRTRPPPAYNNNINLSTTPHRSASCATRVSEGEQDQDQVPKRTLTYRRNSSNHARPASIATRRHSQRRSVSILPIEQSPFGLSMLDYISPLTPDSPEFPVITKRAPPSDDSPESEAESASSAASGSPTHSVIRQPQREPLSSPSSSIPLTVIFTPPRPKPTLQIPSLTPRSGERPSTATKAESDWDSEYNLSLQAAAGKEAKEDVSGSWCCGIFGSR